MTTEEEKWVKAKNGICNVCGEPHQDLDDSDCCADCDRRLKQQAATGRCGWCRRPVRECICED